MSFEILALEINSNSDSIAFLMLVGSTADGEVTLGGNVAEESVNLLAVRVIGDGVGTVGLAGWDDEG